MALTDFGNSGIKIDTSQVTAKTPVTKLYQKDIWEFKVLIDGHWFSSQYDNEGDANTDYGAIT